MDIWVENCINSSGAIFWNNGTFVVRDIKGKPGQVSNHARGCAVDLSYRVKKVAPLQARHLAGRCLNKMIAQADLLGIELVIDYWMTPFGRSWKCDRGAWKYPTSHTFSGAPRGDWFHVEISPALLADSQAVRLAWAEFHKTLIV